MEFEEADMTDVSKIMKLIRPDTKLIMIETPSNPQLKITDISAVAVLAKEHSIITVCDNTFATPFYKSHWKWGSIM